jgi:hypothetical protein
MTGAGRLGQVADDGDVRSNGDDDHPGQGRGHGDDHPGTVNGNPGNGNGPAYRRERHAAGTGTSHCRGEVTAPPR